MIPFITVTILVNNPDCTTNQFVCVRDSLFNLLWTFELSNYVIAFTVMETSTFVDHNHYGWGSFSKWVKDFDKSCYDKLYKVYK